MERWRRLSTTMAVAALALGAAGCRKTVLKGRINVANSDLRNIAVRIIPERDVKAYFDAKAPLAMAALDERRRAYDSASRMEDAANRDIHRAYDDGRAPVTRDGVQVTPLDPSSGPAVGIMYYDKNQHTEQEAEVIARKALPEAQQARAAAEQRWTNEKAGLEGAQREARNTKEGARQWFLAWETDMLADLPQKGEVVYTDAQGRFTSKLPRGEKVAVVAIGDFGSGWSAQRHAWGLWVKLDAAEKPLELAGNNTLVQQPRDSVLR